MKHARDCKVALGFVLARLAWFGFSGLLVGLDV